MKKFRNHTLQSYLDQLAKREPIPGGGSVCALTGALGTGLIGMSAQYSLGRKQNTKAIDRQLSKIIKESDRLRRRLLNLVDEDAQAYLKVVKAKNASPQIKKKADAKARAVPKEIGRLCYQAIQLAPYLVQYGNKYLLSDVEAAVEILQGAFTASQAFQRENF